jgi:hypothetical protein
MIFNDFNFEKERNVLTHDVQIFGDITCKWCVISSFGYGWLCGLCYDNFAIAFKLFFKKCVNGQKQ